MATPVRAEIAFFSSGRTLSIKSHRTDGASLVLELRGGGEIVCDPVMISRIGPDEVPYPEAETAEKATPPVVSVAPEGDSQRFAPMIAKVAAEQGVDPRLVHAVVRVESNYQERARSPK